MAGWHYSILQCPVNDVTLLSEGQYTRYVNIGCCCRCISLNKLVFVFCI